LADRVVLHIGTMKSGTSFVQSALMGNEPALADAGYVYLGKTFAKQSRAVRIELSKDPDRRGKRLWRGLIEEARLHPGKAGVISMEFLSFARGRQLDALLEPLAGLEVQVVLTVRDQFRAIPAQWQTFVRNFGTDDWESYLRLIEAPRLGRGRDSRAFMTFHRAQDLVPMLERWSEHPLVSQLDVVTVPPSQAPRDELWRRFCTTVGLPFDATRLEDTRDNSSLGYASCDYLRRLNVHLSDVAPRHYRRAIRPLTREVLGPLRGEQGRPELDERGSSYALGLNEKVRVAVTRAGYGFVGSLDDLPVHTGGQVPSLVPPAPADQVLRAADATWDHYAQELGVDPTSRPAGLDPVVADGARLLRKVHGWKG
jgi:hypothetical protein